ncbi:F-box protein skip23 [Rhynchospora pubera]|uniref:F-box protein skip23 n=1 Tax=Rhynchospora pubera TaxID=906938 RepID=A0AAV8E6N8_9POAL|nr:F-box protein skip23 [Rhynchospora pubera]
MDWAELNPDLLHHIAKNLRDISDFIRFRAVCRQWRSAVHPCDLPQQLPCFINWKQKSSTSYDIQFCRLFSEKVHTVPINNVFLDPKTPCLFDSLNGLLLIHSQHPSKSWFLLNPLTGFQVQLPVNRDMSYFLLPIYFGPIYGSKPTSVKKCIDVAFRRSTFPDSKFAREDKLCLWRYDYVKWTRIGEVPLLVIRPPSLSVQLTYLVEAGGDLLGVYRDIRLENLTYPKTEYRFEVYCLEEVDTNPFWKKLKCLGGRVLFFDGYYSWLCLNASDLKGCQGNCIYFKTPVFEFNYFEGNTIVRYDLEKDTTEVTVFSDHLRRRWFVPSLC